MIRQLCLVLCMSVAAMTAPLMWADDDVTNQRTGLKTLTVQQVIKLPDESWVKLKGRVVKALGDEKYQFRDATGHIIIEIDDDLWQGRAVTAATNLTIIGELDKDKKSAKRTKIEVEEIHFR